MKRFIILAFIAITASIAALSQAPAAGENVYTVADLNGRASMLVQSELPGDMIMSLDGVTMVVKVLVDTNGYVVSARCSANCPAAATGPAEAAARASKFRPLIVAGRAIKYDGTLMYTIPVEKVNWYRFATALQSAFAFRNLSLGPAAAMLTNAFADERIKLQDNDHSSDLKFRHETMQAVKHSIDAKLKGSDRWWFDVRLCVRAVTVPFQSDQKLDLDGLQDDINYLARFTKSPPADVPPATVEALRSLANYKIDPKMAPKEIRHAIFKIESGIRP